MRQEKSAESEPLPEPGEEFGKYLEQHRQQLERLVHLRMDQRLKGRIDAADVLQEAFIEATNRYESFRHNPDMPLYLWVRFLVCEQLISMRRHHLGTQKRSAEREISIHRRVPEASSQYLAAQLVGSYSTPSHAAVRAENETRLQKALDQLNPLDREIIALRHFEQLPRDATAEILGIQPAAASKRYIRAMQKLKLAIGDSQSG